MLLDHAMLSTWAQSERWEWFAGGDPQVAPRIVPARQSSNSAHRVMFEIGLSFLVPLALATVIGVVFSA
jgi:hypothetical protein